MLDFGEELTLEIFRIPWLIWIQLLVFLLLLALLFFFSIIALDPSHSTSSSSSTTHHSLHHSIAVTNHLHNTRGTENLSIKGEIDASSREIVREEIAERENSALYFLHPCYYFKLARVAFLKCFGLDSSSESDGSSSHKQGIRKEG